MPLNRDGGPIPDYTRVRLSSEKMGPTMVSMHEWCADKTGIWMTWETVCPKVHKHTPEIGFIVFDDFNVKPLLIAFGDIGTDKDFEALRAKWEGAHMIQGVASLYVDVLWDATKRLKPAKRRGRPHKMRLPNREVKVE